ncbi:hypothetical protein CEXT_680431 [Caerostris extrusa]|uniref:Uncharacterized protein n=1 Tax=Caerostris extrusa TaxID=172846 RepID=A0AAV4PLF3_CAEEX|nr:hypothetical protein CEXT_680431 [Caerostris extrusa]
MEFRLPRVVEKKDLFGYIYPTYKNSSPLPRDFEKFLWCLFSSGGASRNSLYYTGKRPKMALANKCDDLPQFAVPFFF